MKTESVETMHNRYIRNARKAAHGETGYERAKAIYHYFEQFTEHPHARYTFEQNAANRFSNGMNERQFVVWFMHDMAGLCAINDMLRNDFLNN